MQGLQTMHYLGLDISKDTIDTYSDASGHLKIANTIESIQELLMHLQAKGLSKETTQVCCEATNVYYLLIATTLHQHGYAVSVVNPLAIKGYNQNEAKTHQNRQTRCQANCRFCQKRKTTMLATQ